MALKDTEYMYISAKIKAREGSTTYSERIRSYLDSRSLSELYSTAIGEAPSGTGDEREALEAYFDKRVEDAFALVKESAPDAGYFDFLLYEYDACNLKTLIKCMIRGISCDGMLYQYSAVSIDALKHALEKRSFDEVLPKNMALATQEAIEAYSKTKDASIIDIIIDKACFADMLENARLCGSQLAIELVKTRIDSINIVTLQRILHSDVADKISTYDMAFIDGADIEKGRLLDVFEREEYTLLDALDGTPYKEMVRSLGKEYSFSALERTLDRKYLSLVEEQKYVPFGFEVACSYLVNTLSEAKNARIIIAGIAAGLDTEKIKERVRYDI